MCFSLLMFSKAILFIESPDLLNNQTFCVHLPCARLWHMNIGPTFYVKLNPVNITALGHLIFLFRTVVLITVS